MGLYLFEILLSFFPTAFFQWGSQVRDYFQLLQLLSAEQNQFHCLISAITALLSSQEFNGSSLTSEQLSSLSLVLEFVEIVLRLSTRGSLKGKEEEEKATEKEVVEEESINDVDEERELATKLCTYTTTENNFMEQHWYYCYTCGLTFSEGVCSVCAKVCHKGHEVSYSRKSRFFCDCGAGAVRGLTCSALKPREYHPPVKSTEANEDSAMDVESPKQAEESSVTTSSGINEQARISIIQQVRQDNLVGILYSIFEKALALMKKEAAIATTKQVELDLMSDKSLQTKSDIYTLKRSLKSGSLDVKLKFDSSNGRDLKTLLSNNTVTRDRKSVV